MKTQAFLAFLLFSLFSLSSRAQNHRLGIIGGTNLVFLDDGTLAPLSPTFGLCNQFSLNKKLSLSSGIELYTFSKSFVSNSLPVGTGPTIPTSIMTHRFRSINLPFTIDWFPRENSFVSLYLGLSPGFTFASQVQLINLDGERQVSEWRRRDLTMNLPIQLGGELNVWENAGYQVKIGGSYQYVLLPDYWMLFFQPVHQVGLYLKTYFRV